MMMIDRQGSACQKLNSYLTERISAVFYAFEHGDSESKKDQKICLSVMLSAKSSNIRLYDWIIQ